MSVEQSVPEFLPVLSGGAHAIPATGACYMEYVSLLAGEKFSDKPRCVDTALTLVMQSINDEADDDSERALLVPLLSRTIGLGPVPRVLFGDRPYGVSPSAWGLVVRDDAVRYARECAQLRHLAWPTFAQRVALGSDDLWRLDKFLSSSSNDSATDLAGWFNDLLSRAVSDLTDETSVMAAAVRWATWLHDAYESAMRTLGWPVVREAVCALPEVAARVGVEARA